MTPRCHTTAQGLIGEDVEADGGVRQRIELADSETSSKDCSIRIKSGYC